MYLLYRRQCVVARIEVVVVRGGEVMALYQCWSGVLRVAVVAQLSCIVKCGIEHRAEGIEIHANGDMTTGTKEK